MGSLIVKKTTAPASDGPIRNSELELEAFSNSLHEALEASKVVQWDYFWTWILVYLYEQSRSKFPDTIAFRKLIQSLIDD